MDELDLATPTVLNTPLEDTKEESEQLIAALPATHPQQAFWMHGRYVVMLACGNLKKTEAEQCHQCDQTNLAS